MFFLYLLMKKNSADGSVIPSLLDIALTAANSKPQSDSDAKQSLLTNTF